MKHDRQYYNKPMFWDFLWWATVAYLVIEIFINVVVFRQLSLKSDYLTIESIAFWGKIITGVSAALAFTKAFYVIKTAIGDYKKKQDIKNGYGMYNGAVYDNAGGAAKIFFLSALFCIPISFYLQNMLIDSIVDNASPEERNKAVLVVSAQATMKPHYQPSTDKEPTVLDKLLTPMGGFKDGFVDNYEQKQNVWFSASRKCIEPSSEALGVTSNIDKAFFAYNALKAPMNESLYKEVITNHHACILDKPLYQKLMWANPTFDDSKVREFHEKYMEKSAEYAKARSEAGQSTWGGFAAGAVDERWNTGVDKLVGFDADIKPNLSYEEFVQHPDVQKYLKRKMKLDDERMVPYSKWFVFQLRDKMADAAKDLLPNTVIPTYVSEGDNQPLGNLIDYPSEYQGEKVQVTEEQVEKSGKRAYKAIIMPIVALGASLLFLLINLIMLASQISVRQFYEGMGMLVPPMGTEIATSILLALIIFGLPIHSINKEAAENGVTLTNVDKAVKLIYYYEKGLAFITFNSNNNIKYAPFEIGDIEGDVMDGKLDIPDSFK